MSDLRDAFRSLRATPVVSIVAILSLALGIGANTAIFSIVDSLLLRALPVKAPRAARDLLGTATVGPAAWTNPIWEQIRERQRSVRRRVRLVEHPLQPARRADRPSSSTGCGRAAGFFDVLGVPAILGRTFTEADDRRGGGPDGAVAVISYGFWQRRFGGAADVIGRSLTVERVPFTIVGVTPPQFLRRRRRPHLRRGHPDRHRAADPRQGERRSTADRTGG